MSACRTCREPMTWAYDARKDKRIPFDPDPVPAGTTGAKVLAVADHPDGPSKVAYGASALAGLLRDHDPRLTHDQAMRKVYDDYPWHLPHWRSCTEPPAPKPPKGTRRGSEATRR